MFKRIMTSLMVCIILCGVLPLSFAENKQFEIKARGLAIAFDEHTRDEYLASSYGCAILTTIMYLDLIRTESISPDEIDLSAPSFSVSLKNGFGAAMKGNNDLSGKWIVAQFDSDNSQATCVWVACSSSDLLLSVLEKSTTGAKWQENKSSEIEKCLESINHIYTLDSASKLAESLKNASASNGQTFSSSSEVVNELNRIAGQKYQTIETSTQFKTGTWSSIASLAYPFFTILGDYTICHVLVKIEDEKGKMNSYPLICYYDGKHIYTWLATNSINNVVNGIIKIFEAQSKYASGGWFADARGNKTWDDSIIYSANYNSKLDVISSSGYRVIQKDMDTFAKYLRTYYSVTTK